MAWGLPFACSSQQGQPDGGTDASSAEADAGCGPFCGVDAPFIDPGGDAAIGLRARSQLDVTCSGGSETGCHVEFAGGTNLEVDRDGAAWGYDPAACAAQPDCTSRCPEGCGIINVPADEMPDVMLVVPYHPESSYLYWKITGDPRRAPGTGIMPLLSAGNYDSGSVDCADNPEMYCSSVVATLGAWIEAGAP